MKSEHPRSKLIQIADGFRLVLDWSSTWSRVHRFTGSPVHRFTGSPVHRFTGSPVHRFTGPIPHFPGRLGQRSGVSTATAASTRRPAATAAAQEARRPQGDSATPWHLGWGVDPQLNNIFFHCKLRGLWHPGKRPVRLHSLGLVRKMV